MQRGESIPAYRPVQELFIHTRPLCYDFPLRANPNGIAQVVIPSDMTRTEADRLCAFVMTLVGPE